MAELSDHVWIQLMGIVKQRCMEQVCEKGTSGKRIGVMSVHHIRMRFEACLQERTPAGLALTKLAYRVAPGRGGVVGNPLDRVTAAKLSVSQSGCPQGKNRHIVSGLRKRGGLAIDSSVSRHIIQNEHQDVHSPPNALIEGDTHVRV
jgi:hypothetical protein